MKKILKIICVTALIGSMMTVNVAAADFTFTFNGTGTQCSGAATKNNTNSSAKVTVTTAGNYAYQYAVGKARFGSYTSGWVTKTGKGSFNIGYSPKPAERTSLYLHGRTVSNVGTSTVRGNWTP